MLSAADQVVLTLMRLQILAVEDRVGHPGRSAQASKPGALWIASGLLGRHRSRDRSPIEVRDLIIGSNGPPQAPLRAISRTVYAHLNGSFGTATGYPSNRWSREYRHLRASPEWPGRRDDPRPASSSRSSTRSVPGIGSMEQARGLGAGTPACTATPG